MLSIKVHAAPHAQIDTIKAAMAHLLVGMWCLDAFEYSTKGGVFRSMSISPCYLTARSKRELLQFQQILLDRRELFFVFGELVAQALDDVGGGFGDEGFVAEF